MPKTTNVFARVEPDIKMRAEAVLDELGLPMSNAISLYLRQIVLRRGRKASDVYTSLKAKYGI
jgi:DNA-damage-inducible protein J